MKRLGVLFLSVLGLAAVGCQRDDSQVGEKLDQIIKQNDEILKALKSGAGAGARAGAAARPERRRPDPQEVYAAVADGPYLGAKDAKVTIVEAFEFA